MPAAGFVTSILRGVKLKALIAPRIDVILVVAVTVRDTILTTGIEIQCGSTFKSHVSRKTQ
jgi:hypothetical protein